MNVIFGVKVVNAAQIDPGITAMLDRLTRVNRATVGQSKELVEHSKSIANSVSDIQKSLAATSPTDALEAVKTIGKASSDIIQRVGQTTQDIGPQFQTVVGWINNAARAADRASSKLGFGDGKPSRLVQITNEDLSMFDRLNREQQESLRFRVGIGEHSKQLAFLERVRAGEASSEFEATYTAKLREIDSEEKLKVLREEALQAAHNQAVDAQLSETRQANIASIVALTLQKQKELAEQTARLADLKSGRISPIEQDMFAFTASQNDMIEKQIAKEQQLLTSRNLSSIALTEMLETEKQALVILAKKHELTKPEQQIRQARISMIQNERNSVEGRETSNAKRIGDFRRNEEEREQQRDLAARFKADAKGAQGKLTLERSRLDQLSETPGVNSEQIEKQIRLVEYLVGLTDQLKQAEDNRLAKIKSENEQLEKQKRDKQAQAVIDAISKPRQTQQSQAINGTAKAQQKPADSGNSVLQGKLSRNANRYGNFLGNGFQVPSQLFTFGLGDRSRIKGYNQRYGERPAQPQAAASSEELLLANKDLALKTIDNMQSRKQVDGATADALRQAVETLVKQNDEQQRQAEAIRGMESVLRSLGSNRRRQAQGR